MVNPKDGGPAFPVSTIDGFTQAGMTVRQYYKAKAVQGMLADKEMRMGSTSDMAREAGMLADAMLAEDEAFAAKQEKGE